MSDECRCHQFMVQFMSHYRDNGDGTMTLICDECNRELIQPIAKDDPCPA